MRKITSIFALLLLCVVTASAAVTVTWESYAGWTRNNVASVWWVGITTPGTTADTYKMSEFQFAQETGFGASTRYACIATVGPTASGATLAESNVLGVSTNSVLPTSQSYYTYNLDSEIELTGGTTYYMVFLESNTASGGYYTVGAQRVSLNTSYGTYAAGTMSSGGALQSTWTPGFKATLSTDAVYTVNYTCVSTADNGTIDSGSFTDVVGTITAPSIAGYTFSHATTTGGDSFTITNEVTEDLDLILYYTPTYDVVFRVLDADNNELATYTQSISHGTTVTAIPEALDYSVFYDYSTINQTVTGATTIDVTATMKETPLFKFNTSAEGTLVYNTLKLKNANYPTYVASGTPNVTLPTSNADDETTQWAFIGNPYAGFKIINRAAGTALVLGYSGTAVDGSTGGATYATLATSGSQDYETWYAVESSSYTNGFYLFGGEGYALNQRSTANLAFWTGGYDAGSTFVATEVPEGKEAYEALIAALEAIDYGPALGQYTLTGDHAGYAGNEAEIISMIKTSYGDAGNYEEGKTAAQAMINATTINLPQAGMFLRFKSVHDTYLSGTESTASAGRLSYTATTDASNIFYFDGTYLYDFKNGVAAAGRAVGSAGTTGVAYWFEESTITAGKYVVRFNPDGNVDRYLYAWDTSRNYADQNGSDHANCAFTLEEVTELPLTLNGGGQADDQIGMYYATLCLPVDFTISGATAYTATLNSEKTRVSFTELGTEVPANAAVLVKGTSESATITLADNDVEVDAEANALENVLGGIDISSDATKLSLGIVEGNIGFYMYEGAIGSFKAYLNVSGSESRAFVINFDDVTGISSVEAAKANGQAIYDLQGRRVQNAQKGIYIIGGRKVLVK